MASIGTNRRHRAGALNQLLSFEKPISGGLTDSNQPIQSWSGQFSAWGSVQQLGGEELNEAQRIQSRATHRVVIRHRTDAITPEWRVVTPGGKNLSIVSVGDPTGRSTHLSILAREAVA